GDLIVAVDGRPVRHWEDMGELVTTSRGRPLKLTIKRGGAEQTVTVTPRLVTVRDPIFREPKESWELGVGPQLTPQIGSVTGGSAAEKAGLKPGDLVRAVADQPVFTPEELMQAIQKRAGQTFEVAAEAGRQWREGLASLTLFTAVISVNLAVLNLLPVPMLDGGHLFFFVIEAVLGRPLSLRKREWAQQVGLVLLMLLMVYALYN